MNFHLPLILITFSFCNYLSAQKLESTATRSLYSITEGYWIRDTAIINLREIGYSGNSVILFEEPGTANADTGFFVIDRRMEEEDVMAVGKIMETDKAEYLYFLDERDPQGKVIKSPNPANVSAYEWNFLGFSNHDTAENAIILREYLEGSLEVRGKKWYLFMIQLEDRKNESFQIYGYLIE